MWFVLAAGGHARRTTTLTKGVFINPVDRRFDNMQIARVYARRLSREICARKYAFEKMPKPDTTDNTR
jgi:hypothetical protein